MKLCNLNMKNTVAITSNFRSEMCISFLKIFSHIVFAPLKLLYAVRPYLMFDCFLELLTMSKDF